MRRDYHSRQLKYTLIRTVYNIVYMICSLHFQLVYVILLPPFARSLYVRTTPPCGLRPGTFRSAQTRCLSAFFTHLILLTREKPPARLISSTQTRSTLDLPVFDHQVSPHLPHPAPAPHGRRPLARQPPHSTKYSPSPHLDKSSFSALCPQFS